MCHHRFRRIRIGPPTGKVGSHGQQQRRGCGRRRAIYGLGIFGAFVYYWQAADQFWEYMLAFVAGLFWPAFMVYEVFKTLGA